MGQEDSEWITEALQPSRFTVAVVGDTGTGKSSLVRSFAGAPFKENIIRTSIAASTEHVMFIDKKDVIVTIWDVSGLERFRRYRSYYYKQAHAFIITYDVTNRTSLDNVKHWLREVRNISKTAPIALAGTKCDSPNVKLPINSAEKLASANRISYYNTSAKENWNIGSVFENLYKCYLVMSTERSGWNRFLQLFSIV